MYRYGLALVVCTLLLSGCTTDSAPPSALKGVTAPDGVRVNAPGVNVDVKRDRDGTERGVNVDVDVKPRGDTDKGRGVNVDVDVKKKRD